jgi:pepF/M3 family oligoendopeptidase
MNYQWNLDSLYPGFDESYEQDLITFRDLIKTITKITKAKKPNQVEYLESYLQTLESINLLASKLGGYPSLIRSTDVNNEQASLHLARFATTYNEIVDPQCRFILSIKKYDLESLIPQSEILTKYAYYLRKAQEVQRHLMSRKEEMVYAKLSEIGSSSWGELQELATANLSIPFRGATKTLSEIRNLAYDPDPAIRREAYEAELAAYPQVESFVALGLSNIKRDTIYRNKQRHYASPLHASLDSSDLQEKSLNALLDAIKEYRPVFASYLKAKASHLGYSNGLPFYEMFAPVGQPGETYSIEDAKNLVLQAYDSFSPRLGNFARKAFAQEWVDFLPHAGKVGGAFCAGISAIKESRVLTNFTGVLSDCLTLAHELGHAYHDEVIYENPPLNQEYPMQLAETASIFCETITNNYLLQTITSPAQRLAFLENSIQDATQVIIDILSRFLFEKSLINEAKEGPVSASRLKELMLSAQKEAYLDGLDPDLLHPYMWLCKGHYYSSSFNFYNFPYAFGLLYGKGLYALYQKDPENFIPRYDAMLQATGFASSEDVAQTMGIDITDTAFWKESLEQIKQQIDEVITLLEQTK